MPDIEINVTVPSVDVNLPCGDANVPASYTVQAEITQELATCSGADFNTLYDLIEKIVDKNLGAVKCPSDCNRLGPLIIAQSWGCNTSDHKNVAEVKLAKKVYCTPKDGIDFPFPKRPDKADLMKPGNDGQFQSLDGTDHTEIDPIKIPPCGNCVAVKLTYKQEVKECTVGMDLGPYVKSADSRADDFIALIQCEDAGCTVKIENRQHTETCEKKVVIVTIEFNLCCFKKAAPVEPH